MPRPAKEIIDRLGRDGLRCALDDLLDQDRLVRLANACGIKYRGMRTQSQSRTRLLADVVQKARRQAEVRKAVLRALDKEAGKASREWEGLDTEEKVRRLSDDRFLQANGNVGLHLYLLASAVDGAELDGLGTRLAHEHLLRIASNGTPQPETPVKTSRDEERLRRQAQQRERKLRHLEGQLAKARDAQKSAKQDLIQRKGELAESRMLVERLRREVAEAHSAAQALTGNAAQSTASDKTTADLARTVRQLVSEHKKLVHRLKSLAEKKPSRTDAAPLREILDALKQLDKRMTAEAGQRDSQHEALSKRVDALRGQLRERPATPTKPARRPRAKGPAQRVGVFIDVQNMYYAARRLKGKLDFAALLEAAVQERRLIKATAYVVESKETDQSQFIGVLRKLAIEVRRKTVQVRADGSRKGDWDMELALDILDAARKLDVVVLVSGDGDFTSLVERVKSMGPRVEVIAFPRNTAKSLVQAADSFQPLDRKFMIYGRPVKEPAKPALADKKPDEAKARRADEARPKSS